MHGGMAWVPTRRGDDVDDYHGVPVADPYRWLEAGDDPEVRDWVAAQNRRTRTALDALPDRASWHDRLSTYMGLPIVQAVEVRGDLMVTLERPAGAQQAALVARSIAASGAPPVVLVDPGASADDAAVAVDWFETSDDGSLVVFGVSEGGTENSELRIVRTADASLLDEAIPNCRAASVAWDPDGSAFWYTRYPEGDQYHRTVHHHTIGDAADGADDPVVWDRHPTPETWPSVAISPDGRRLLVHASVGWGRTDVQVLDRADGTWTDVIVGVDAVSSFSFADDGTLVGVTTLGAPRGRVVRVDPDTDQVSPEAWQTIVPERDVVTTAVRWCDGDLLVATFDHGVDAIERWDAEGLAGTEVRGIGVGSIVQLTVDRSSDGSGDAYVVVTGFDRPASVWRIEHDQVQLVHPAEPAGVIPDLEVSHVEYPSLDGTPIGLFLIHRADAAPSPDTPTILNGYGGFAITESPIWSATIAAWCESGGLYAIAGLRGGFEHGDDWHRAGRRENKQNVFDDFHAAADWLVETGRTSRDRLAIAGGSNGGLLVGAALTQRPDLCRAVWCAVPLLDMIRFPEFLIARLWTDEYGDPGVADEFDWLIGYSPYHRVTKGIDYPAVLLTTAEGDSRVDPSHARKMAAALQAASADQDARPVLLHQEDRAGHGVGKPVGKRADEQADVLAFLGWQLGHEPPTATREPGPRA